MNISIKERKRYKCKFTPEIEEYIQKYINKHPLINGKQFSKHIRKKFNITFSLDTLYKWFNKMKITYKKVNKKKMFICKKKEKLLKELYNNINNVSEESDIISIDECHFYLNMIPEKGWSVYGTKIYKNIYNKVRKGVSLLMAINKGKVIGYIVSEQSINAVIFTDFIKQINQDNYIYLMDNARIHHAKIFKEYMSTQKSKTIYNVPYNPETNPIEHVFSTLKHNIVKYTTSNLDNLKKAISTVIKKVQSDHLKNYYKKSLNI